MSYVKEAFDKVKLRDPDQPEFHQAVWEVLETLEPVFQKHKKYQEIKKKKIREKKIKVRIKQIKNNLKLKKKKKK